MKGPPKFVMKWVAGINLLREGKLKIVKHCPKTLFC
jgi:hypothetical protein